MPLWMFFDVLVFFLFLSFLLCGFNSIIYPNPAIIFLFSFVFNISSLFPYHYLYFIHLIFGSFFFVHFVFWMGGSLNLLGFLTFFFLHRVGSETVSACRKHPKRSSPCLETGMAPRVWKDDYASDVLLTWCVTSWCGTVSSRLSLHCPQMTATDR